MGELVQHTVQVTESYVPTFDYLSILARAKAALDAATEVAVNISEIRRYEKQPRVYFNPVALRSLSNSIAAGGQTTSGLIRENPGPTRYQLIDGERRWRAVSMIPEDDRPLYKAKLIVADDDVVQFLISGISNFNREGHTAIETMNTIHSLTKFGFPMEEIAVVLGISVNWALQIHSLKKLVPEVQALLDPTVPKKIQLPVTAAIQIAKIEGRFQVEIARRVIARDVTLAKLRSEVVRVATKAGSPIRIREVDPRKRFNSLSNKSEVTLRTAEDIYTLLQDPEVKRLMKSRISEIREIRRRLHEARDQIFACEKLLEIVGF